jgi:PadR family transcriptional regulator, regulatory protein PadR
VAEPFLFDNLELIDHFTEEREMFWWFLVAFLIVGLPLLICAMAILQPIVSRWLNPQLEDHILAVLLRRGEMYPLDLQDGIEEDFGYVPLASNVYLKLRALEREGVVTSRWGEPQEDCGGARRKYYRLSGKKRFHLKERRTHWFESWLSNPSHISLAVLLTGNPGLQEAHRMAVQQTLDLIERKD